MANPTTLLDNNAEDNIKTVAINNSVIYEMNSAFGFLTISEDIEEWKGGTQRVHQSMQKICWS